MFKKILALLLIATPAFAEVPRDCDIKIEFNTYTASVDMVTYKAVMDRILKTPEITEKHAMNLGPQGERTLCLNLAKEANLDKVYEDLKSLIPVESKTGWEKITSRTGAEFQTKKTELYIPYDWDR